MANYHYPAARAVSTNITRAVPRTALAMGGIGLLIGSTSAAAKNIRRVKNAEIDRKAAVRNTLNETAGAGLASAAAAALVGTVGATGLASLVGILAVATGTKYLWDSTMPPEPGLANHPEDAKPSSPKAQKKTK
jgi:uncharacterized membrane protein YfcA